LPKLTSKEDEEEEGVEYGLNSYNYWCRPMVSNLLAADTPWGGGGGTGLFHGLLEFTKHQGESSVAKERLVS